MRTIDQLQPYFTAFNALFSVATLALILSIIKSVRDNAQDRIAVQDERLKRADDELKRTEKWADREKLSLKEELNKAQSKMDEILKKEGIDLINLTLGKQLVDATAAVQQNVQSLIAEMQEKINQLEKIDIREQDDEKAEWELSLAMGEMAFGSFARAAAHFDTYSKVEGRSWEADFTRGVAHANARGGFQSNLASLMAYNDAIALAPTELDFDRRARLFGYRGAMLKRLKRLEEAEADLKIGLSFAKAKYERHDIHYNLACVYAMKGDKRRMMIEINELKTNRRFLRAIQAHKDDYFASFMNDRDFRSIISE